MPQLALPRLAYLYCGHFIHQQSRRNEKDNRQSKFKTLSLLHNMNYVVQTPSIQWSRDHHLHQRRSRAKCQGFLLS